MSRFFLLLFLTGINFFFSNQIQTTISHITHSEPVTRYVSVAENFMIKTGIHSFIQDILPNTLKTSLENTRASINDESPVIKEASQLLQRHLQIYVGNLPQPVETSLKETVTDKITIVAGDSGVSEKILKTNRNIINEISLPTLKAKLNLVPESKTNIVLYSTAEHYGQALLKAGLSPSAIPSIVQNTGGITVNSSIWIPLYNLHGKGDIANVLTHELTHVALNQAGIGGKLPLWLNEGTAWFTGLAANEIVNPIQAKLETAALKENIAMAAKQGKLLPLNSMDQTILQVQYNYEFQGFLATDALIKKYGLETFKAFLQQTSSQGVKRSFSLNFNQTLDAYENTFDIMNYLK